MNVVTECVHAYSSGWTATAADSTFHTLGMDSEVIDTGSYHDNVTNNSRLTFPSGGPFLVFGHPQWSNPGFNCTGHLIKNGSPITGGTDLNYWADGFSAGPLGTGMFLFWLENFSAGAYVETQTWCDAGGTPNAKTQMVALAVSEWSAHVWDNSSVAATATLTFANVVYDPHGMQTASDRLVAQKAGYYLILTNQNNAVVTAIYKNGSASRLNGSYDYTFGAGGSLRSAGDYAFDWFNVGDYVQMKVTDNTVNNRQFAMIYMGGSAASIAYTYNNSNILASSYDYLYTDTEWFDGGGIHPRSGSNGYFNTNSGNHLAIAKISTNGASTFTNDGAQIEYNGSLLGNEWATSNRHLSGSQVTTIAVSCFSSAANGSVRARWHYGDTTSIAYTPYTNVLVTDASNEGTDVIMPLRRRGTGGSVYRSA